MVVVNAHWLNNLPLTEYLILFSFGFQKLFANYVNFFSLLLPILGKKMFLLIESCVEHSFGWSAI